MQTLKLFLPSRGVDSLVTNRKSCLSGLSHFIAIMRYFSSIQTPIFIKLAGT